MSLYKKVPTGMGFAAWEGDVLQFWKDNDIFRKSLHVGQGKPPYVFYDGPPTANGTPHIGHAMTRVVKDTVPRFWAMKAQRFRETSPLILQLRQVFLTKVFVIF